MTAVTVRILINEELPPADLSYIRSLVPIVADFDPERGDLLEIEVVSPEGSFPRKKRSRKPSGNPEPPLRRRWRKRSPGSPCRIGS